MAEAPHIVRAAGAVLVRDGAVAVVHRPRYDDWTLPKGKNDPGEDDRDRAIADEHGAGGTDDVGSLSHRLND